MSPFAYARPREIEAAVGSAARHRSDGGREPGVDFLAGGTDLVQLMAERLRAPGCVVDVTALRGLDAIEVEANGARLGALVRMGDAAAHPELLRLYPLIPQALLASASGSVRNMATLGGNVLQRTRCGYFRDSGAPCAKREPGTGCPAIAGRNRDNAVLGTSEHCIATYMSDFANALAVYDAAVRIAGPAGERTCRFLDLHREPGDTPAVETRLGDGELILGFDLPPARVSWRSTYLKVRDRRSFQWAIASAAVVLDLNEGEVRDARIAVGGVATKPWRLPKVEESLRGRLLTAELAREVARHAADGAVTHGGNDHKPELIRRTVARAIETAGGLA